MKRKKGFENSVLTGNIGIRANLERERDVLLYDIFRAAITASSVAEQHLLETVQTLLAYGMDENGLLDHVDLFMPITENVRGRVQERIDQDIKPTKQTSPKELARPRYPNTYRMMEIMDWQGSLSVRCRIAERFFWKGTRGELKGKLLTDLDMIDSKIGLQALLKSYLPVDWSHVPSVLRAGVCQQVAQAINSYIGLLNAGKKVSFPSLLDRDPETRHAAWLQSLTAVCTGTHAFDYVRARDLLPGKYSDDDPRGDRLVNADEDWVDFSSSPFPGRLPLHFVAADDVVVYKRSVDGRLYASLPLFNDVTDNSPLGRLSHNKQLFWWEGRAEEFTPLPAWKGASLSMKNLPLLVQLESRNPKWIQRMLSAQHGRKVCWTLVTEKAGKRGRKKNRKHFVAHVATNREVKKQLRPNVLGIHFGIEPIIWWALANDSGEILKEGSLAGNEILSAGLAQQLRLQEDQGEWRWVGGKQFEAELKRRTTDISKQIVRLAADLDANLALEKIGWVEKRKGGRDANRRHSMWNVAQLPSRISGIGLEQMKDGTPAPVLTIKHVSDFLLRFTCPECGACRNKGQKKPATELQKGVLVCNRCKHTGGMNDRQQARYVTALGVDAYNKLLAETVTP